MGDEDYSQWLSGVESYSGDEYDPKKLSAGETSVADGDTITHGHSAMPDFILLTSTVKGLLAAVTAAGASTFTVGQIRVNFGKETISDGSGNISHGLGETPTAVFLQAETVNRTAWPGTLTSSVIPVTVKKTEDNSTVSPEDVDVYWVALVFPTSASDIQWQTIGAP